VGHGLVPKFGRFLSGVGYVNEQHQHVWDFFDAPLPYQAFFGSQFRSDGLQLKWVAPTETFLEFGGEIGDGKNFRHRPTRMASAVAPPSCTPAAPLGASTNGVPACLPASSSEDRQYTQTDLFGNSVPELGKSRLTIADLSGNGRWQRDERQLRSRANTWRKQATYLRQRRRSTHQHVRHSSRQRVVCRRRLQFLPHWRVGGRYDRLSPAPSIAAPAACS
jgi:hypothetical protein